MDTEQHRSLPDSKLQKRAARSIRPHSIIPFLQEKRYPVSDGGASGSVLPFFLVCVGEKVRTDPRAGPDPLRKKLKTRLDARHASCYFSNMTLVIVLWVCLSVAGCLALLSAASRHVELASSSVPLESQTYTSTATPAAVVTLVMEPRSRPAFSSSSGV